MALSKIDIENMVTGELTTTNGGTGATSFTGGISAAQIWRLTTNFTGDASPIASNLEAADSYSPGAIGSAMTESSGVFTFPSTGMWLIQVHGEFYYNGDSRFQDLSIEVTTDNSSYNSAAKNSAGITQAESNHTYNGVTAQIIFDVTNVSTHKVRFSISCSNDSTTTTGNTNYNRTSMTFIRLGDT